MTCPQPTQTNEVDWNAARMAVQNDDGLLRDIVQTMLQELPRFRSEIALAMSTQNARRLEIAAHTLKSSLRYFGCGTAVQLALQLEQLGERHALAEAPAVWQLLEPRVERLRVALVDYLEAATKLS